MSPVTRKGHLGPSQGSTSSTELLSVKACVQNFRNNLYNNKKAHATFKMKDAAWQRIRTFENAIKRQDDSEAVRKYRERKVEKGKKGKVKQ